MNTGTGADAVADLADRLGRWSSNLNETRTRTEPLDAVELVRGGLVADGLLTVDGELVRAALTDAPAVAMAAAGVAIGIDPTSQGRATWAAALQEPRAQVLASASEFLGRVRGDEPGLWPAIGASLLAVDAAQRCRELAWQKTRAVAEAFRAVALARATWAMLHTGADRFVLRHVLECYACQCFGTTFAPCASRSCPRGRAADCSAADCREVWRLDALGEEELRIKVGSRVQHDPMLVAQAAAAAALCVIGDPSERIAWRRAMRCDDLGAGAAMGTGDFATGARSPRILRSWPAALAAMAVASRLSAAGAHLWRVPGPQAHAWSAVLLSRAAWAEVGAERDHWRDLLRILDCPHCVSGAPLCERPGCPASMVLADAVVTSATGVDHG